MCGEVVELQGGAQLLGHGDCCLRDFEEAGGQQGMEVAECNEWVALACGGHVCHHFRLDAAELGLDLVFSAELTPQQLLVIVCLHELLVAAVKHLIHEGLGWPGFSRLIWLYFDKFVDFIKHLL